MTSQRFLATAVLAFASLAAQAQYKVVGPDGRVTYTDRPESPASGAKVQTMRGGTVQAAPAVAAVALPIELRNVAVRFPVTLYTGNECQPCDNARKLLQQRGIPFTERTVSTDDDVIALQRLSGGRSLPAMLVGSQALRGFLDSEWQSTLDLAGYPRESRLPRNYQAPAPAPLAPRAPVAAEAPPPARPSAELQAPAVPASGIRF